MIQKHRLLTSLALTLLLVACSDGTGGDGGSGGTQAPTAVVMFPPAISMTEGEAVTVHGTAADGGTIASVQVNGVEAFTADGYATWFAAVPLTPGMNTLTVGVSDSQSNSDAQAAEVVIERQARVGAPSVIAFDAANNRVLVKDRSLAAVIAIDLTTGIRTVLSNDTTPNASNPFSRPQGIAVDSINNQALVTDSDLNAIIAVNLTSGARTVLSDATTPNASNPFGRPQGIAVDSVNNRALVTDASLKAIIAVNLTSGARTVLSEPSLRWI